MRYSKLEKQEEKNPTCQWKLYLVMNRTEQQEIQNALFLVYSASPKNTLLRFCVVGFKRRASNVDPADFLAVSIAPTLNHCDYGTTEALKCCFWKLPWRAITHSLRPSSPSSPPADAPLSTNATWLGLTSTFKNLLNRCFFFSMFFPSLCLSSGREATARAARIVTRLSGGMRSHTGEA